MSRPLLSETLLALVEGVDALGDGLVAMDVDLLVPMEVSIDVGAGGAIVLHAAPGHTRFVSGLLPSVHLTRLHIVAGEPG